MQEYKDLLQSAQKLIDVLSDLPAEPVGKPKDVLATIEALENQLEQVEDNLSALHNQYGYDFAHQVKSPRDYEPYDPEESPTESEVICDEWDIDYGSFQMDIIDENNNPDL
jgi:hypothetical protein